MSIVRLISKKKPYPFPEYKEQCNFLNNSVNALYYGTLHGVNFRPIWTCSFKNGTFYPSEAMNSILPKQSITDLFIGKIKRQQV